MPTYQYECMDSKGKMLSGRVEAPTEADAQQELHTQGLFVTQLIKVAGPDKAGKEQPASAHVGRNSSGCFSARVLFLLFLLSVGVVTLTQ